MGPCPRPAGDLQSPAAAAPHGARPSFASQSISQPIIECIKSTKQSLNSSQFELSISCINESIIAQNSRAPRVICASQPVNQSINDHCRIDHSPCSESFRSRTLNRVEIKTIESIDCSITVIAASSFNPRARSSGANSIVRSSNHWIESLQSIIALRRMCSGQNSASWR
jgi:hypothetical protein